MHCKHPGCAWKSIAPSEEVAWNRYAEHVVREHASPVEADVPEGMVQIKLRRDGEWITTTPEEAHELHERFHGS